MIRLFSPAKINLFFKMMGLREDGYHNLHSFFQAINLGDILTFSKASKDTFESTEPSLKWDSHNFIYKAVQLFREKSQIFDPIKITLEKKIPIEAGLGGGSSNMATTLWGLNELFQKPFFEETLFEWSKELGSDVPFFFSHGSAVCKGRGEIVIEMKKPEMHKSMWVVKPNLALSTQAVYRQSEKRSQIKESLETLTQKIYSKAPIYKNDLEKGAFLVSPKLALLKKELLSQGFKEVFMTGSGSGYVCLGENKPIFKNPVKIFPIQYINRGSNQWYEEKENAPSKR